MKKNQKNHGPKKFCKFHESRSHNTSECIALKRKTTEYPKLNTKENKSFAINEIKSNPKTIEIPISVEGMQYEALIDTGSVENYIPERIVNKLNLETIDLIKKMMTEVGNGSTMEIKNIQTLNFVFLMIQITFTHQNFISFHPQRSEDSRYKIPNRK
ncbi:hypothetical protein DMUE_4892 [Dictyocoela muelleri]|nr:hypothetical protein DMUE_4892 [Dictyocoela muelleri]